jgi:hypothetical protein
MKYTTILLVIGLSVLISLINARSNHQAEEKLRDQEVNLKEFLKLIKSRPKFNQHILTSQSIGINFAIISIQGLYY